MATRVSGRISPDTGREELGPPATALSDRHGLAVVVLIVADGVAGRPVSKQPERCNETDKPKDKSEYIGRGKENEMWIRLNVVPLLYENRFTRSLGGIGI